MKSVSIIVRLCLLFTLQACIAWGQKEVITEPLVPLDSVIYSASEIEDLEDLEYLERSMGVSSIASTAIQSKSSKSSKSSNASAVNIPMQFFAQAPHGNWDMPFQEACEEMAVLLVYAYLTGTQYTADSISETVVDFTGWIEQAGYHYSVSIYDVAEITEQYLGVQTEVVEGLTVEIIEHLVASGYPVVVPADGQKLPNPYFSGDGPTYHMLVISGYNKHSFITQEVGTKMGENYMYKKEVLFDAIADYVDEGVLDGKRGLVMSF